jgi:hypothetical protein
LRRSVTPAAAKNSFFARLRSAADLPEKKLVSCTRSYAGRGSSQKTVMSNSPRAASCSRKRWPTMPLPMTTIFMRSGAPGPAPMRSTFPVIHPPTIKETRRPLSMPDVFLH